jgi:hypothetical protein
MKSSLHVEWKSQTVENVHSHSRFSENWRSAHWSDENRKTCDDLSCKRFFKNIKKKKKSFKIVISQGVVELGEIVTFGGDTFWRAKNKIK